MPLILNRLSEAGLLQPRRDHGHRADDRRGGRRRRRGSRPGRRPAGRRSGQGRRAGWRSCSGNLAPDGAVVKVAGTERLGQSGPARVFEREEDCFAAVKAGRHQPRRRDRDPQRGPDRRPRDARDAPGHRRDRRQGPRRGGRADHRRPLLGGDARADDRPRRARGRQGRPDRRRSARATRSRSTSRRGRSMSSSRDEEIAERVAAYEPPEPAFTSRRDGEVRGRRLERLRRRRHVLGSARAVQAMRAVELLANADLERVGIGAGQLVGVSERPPAARAAGLRLPAVADGESRFAAAGTSDDRHHPKNLLRNRSSDIRGSYSTPGG